MTVSRLTPVLVPAPGCDSCRVGPCLYHQLHRFERRDLVFRLWLPGQVPSGSKYGAALVETTSGKRAWVPKKHTDSSGRKVLSPLERWRNPVVERFDKGVLRPLRWTAPLRVEVDYLRKTTGDADEANRSQALSHLLEKTGMVVDDAVLRFEWRYRGLNRKRPGVLLMAWSEPEITVVGPAMPETDEIWLEVA